MLRGKATSKKYSDDAHVGLQLWLQTSLREEPWTPLRVHVRTTANSTKELDGSKRGKPTASRRRTPQPPAEHKSSPESGSQNSSCGKEIIEPDEPGLLSRKLHAALGSVV